MLARSRSLVLAAALAICALASPGCAGNSTRQDLSGQTASDSPQSKGTFVDNPDGNGTGTSTFDVPGTVEVVKATVDNIEAKSGGAGFRTMVLTEKNAVIRSPSDVTAEGVEIDPTTKSIKVAKLSTSASAGTAALSPLIEQYRGVYASWDDARKQQFRDGMDAIKTVAPGIVEAIKTIVGAP